MSLKYQHSYRIIHNQVHGVLAFKMSAVNHSRLSVSQLKLMCTKCNTLHIYINFRSIFSGIVTCIQRFPLSCNPLMPLFTFYKFSW